MTAIRMVSAALLFATVAHGQSAVSVYLEDSTGASVRGGKVTAVCAAGGKTVVEAGESGVAVFAGLPQGTCRFVATARELRSAEKPFDVSASSELHLQLEPLTLASALVVTAGAEELRQTATTSHRTMDARQIAEVPIYGNATAFTDLITRTTPGVAADANGFAHPLGEHADTSISIDGQPITDQMAKVFSNQLNPQIIETMTATTGAPPAEFGDKTSLVIAITTKSGLGRPFSGAFASEYGSFGTVSESVTAAIGGQRWGNFLAVTGGRSNRFLDTPEFQPIHDRGHSASFFDRLDWLPRPNDSLHLNLFAGLSAFDSPNSYDTEALGQEQRSNIRNGGIAAGWIRTLSPRLLNTVTAFYRADRALYLPSSNPFADRPASLEQNRTLRNMGLRTELAFVNGSHTAKLGAVFSRTPLRERFAVGLTDPLYNAVCQGQAEPSIRSPENCAAAGFRPNPDFVSRLLPYDISRGGTLYRFDRSAVIRQAAFYLQDEMKWRGWIVSAGLRYDIYHGLSRGYQMAPRFGLAWQVPRTGTLLRASYSRLFETPYNENLIFANEAEADAGNPFGSYRAEPVRPGTRNQFNVGLAQSIGKHITVDADYYWKFTRTAYDFDTLFNTPVTFSVAFRKSKIDGLAVRVNFLDWHGLTASTVMGHVRSRFFGPEVGGLIFNQAPESTVFRIDHGEEFEQTTALRYQAGSKLFRRWRPWAGFTWRYNSGLALPDTVPRYTDALQLTANEQFQIGLRCGQDFATPQRAIRNCTPELFSTDRIRIPALGTQDDDRNPVRVSPRHLFDLSAGEDEVWKRERLTVGVRATVFNLTNRSALYNFLSTFSGTHFVPPRTITAGIIVRF